MLTKSEIFRSVSRLRDKIERLIDPERKSSGTVAAPTEDGVLRSASELRAKVEHIIGLGLEARTESNRRLSAMFEDIVASANSPVVLEIGARQADFSFSMSSRMPSSQFYCFEANRHSYEHFSKRFHTRENVHYLHRAISDRDGVTKIRIPLGIGPDTLIKGNASLNCRNLFDKGYVEEDVECSRLDAVCEQYLAGQRFSAWIDVEGHFREVHAGGTETFARMDAVLIEVEERLVWENQALSREVFALLCGHGLQPVARDAERPDQYNVVFVSKDLLETARPYVDRYHNEVLAIR